MAAGQLLWWKGDVDQDGHLLLKSVYVLTGTDSVSFRPSASALGTAHPGAEGGLAQSGGMSQKGHSFHKTDLLFLLPPPLLV